MKKVYVLDTNVLLHDPDSIFKFEENSVVIPDVVIEELDTKKEDKRVPSDVRWCARRVSRHIEDLRKKGDILHGLNLPDGGTFRVETDCKEVEIPEYWDMRKADNNILRIAKGLTIQEEAKDTWADKNQVILVSKDLNMRIKAALLEVEVQDYENDIVEDTDLVYDGRSELELTDKQFEEFRTTGQVILTDREIKSFALTENEYLGLTSYGKVVNLGRYSEGKIVALRYENATPCDISLLNTGQKFAAEALLAPASEVPLVILKGPAGTAKTFLTLACGLEKVIGDIKRPEYRKVLITRANVSFDNDIGALPGTEIDKVSPLLRGCLDNLELILDSKSVEKGGEKSELELKDKVAEVFEHGWVSVEALGFLRGRSITNQYILIDEAQNTTPNQMLGLLTRVGKDTKIVICGDINQIDNTKLDKHTNGLAYALKGMRGSKLCHILGFSESETTRSELAKEAAHRLNANE